MKDKPAHNPIIKKLNVMKHLRDLAYSGVTDDLPASTRLILLLTNSLSLFMLFACLVIAVFFTFNFGVSNTSLLIVLAGLLFATPIVFNALQLIQISRFILSAAPPLIIMAIIILNKLDPSHRIEPSGFFESKILLLATCIVPMMCFELKEKWGLTIGILASMLMLTLYDPIHEFFGVGFYQLGFTDTSYGFFSNVIISIAFLFILSCVLFFKYHYENAQDRKEDLIVSLKKTNNELQGSYDQIETQNEEIRAQSEELASNQNRLTQALLTIEDQQEQLKHYNKNLENELLQKNEHLSEANLELIKYNNELRQFSYTISHNLRGPVASILGLMALMDKGAITGNNEEIVNHLEKSVVQLDATIRDLTKIIDIRNDIYGLKERISMEEEFEKVHAMLEEKATQVGASIHYDFSKAPIVYGVRALITSILYNLTSNAIKYHSPDRPPRITLKTEWKGLFTVITVRDNGLGINLEKNKNKLFGMYNRFHDHIEGKGLGLYLVKMQAELLGGKVEVDSSLNEFTEFRVYVKNPKHVNKQVIEESSFADIFYDADLNCLTLVWKGDAPSEEYHRFFEINMEILHAYRTGNWITDARNRGKVSAEDLEWMVNKMLPQAYAKGLRHLAYITHKVEDENHVPFFDKIRTAVNKEDFIVKRFDSLEEAKLWIEVQNKEG
jgi:signal transduction histidine kinase